MSEKYNHGTADQGGIKVPYGKDSSEHVGSASAERIPNKMGGGTENLSHTLSGGSANQRQK